MRIAEMIHPGTAAAEDRQPAEPQLIWGQTACGLHERYWAGRRVAVVRPDEPAPPAAGPHLYLLAPRDLGVVFDVTALARQMTWMRVRAVRVRVVESAKEGYAERVVVGEGDRFQCIQREYGARTRSTAQVWLTAEVELARRWAEARDLASAHAILKECTSGGRRLGLRAEGSIVHLTDGESEQAVRLLMQKWRPGESLKGVYEYDRGVWLHESVNVSASACLVAPVWLGAGVQIGEDDVIIGPVALGDAPGAETARPMSWDEMRLPRWRLLPRSAKAAKRRGKRLFDIAFSLCALAATLPLYPFIMLAILLEDGRPFFFAHRRQTIRGKEFPCLKFRTMCRDADRMKAALAAENACDGPQFFMEKDPRLLRIGGLLRRYQLDELPQFWNVLLGHMSIVGPRPSPDGENQYCPAWREARLSVRPGVTGLWQIRRTREPLTDFQEWIRYDLEYVQHQSWRLDLWVIGQTIRTVLFGSS